MKESLEWFDSLDQSEKTEYIDIIYKLHKTYVVNNKDIKKSLNKLDLKWQKLFSTNENKYALQIKELETELSILRNYGNIENKLNDYRLELSNYHKDLMGKLSCSQMGKAGEKWIYDTLLSNYPTSLIIDTSSKRGCGDLLLSHDGAKIMIESKNHTDDSLRKDPNGTIGRFISDATNAFECKQADIAIFVAHRASSIPGKGSFIVEKIMTNTGTRHVVYIANVYNIPNRLIAAVELCTKIINDSDIDNFDDELYTKLRLISDKLGYMVETLKDKKKMVSDLRDIVKKDEEHLNFLKETLVDTVSGDKKENKEIVLDKLTSLYRIESSGGDINIRDFEKMVLEKGMKISDIKDVGGFSRIKTKSRTFEI